MDGRCIPTSHQHLDIDNDHASTAHEVARRVAATANPILGIAKAAASVIAPRRGLPSPKVETSAVPPQPKPNPPRIPPAPIDNMVTSTIISLDPPPVTDQRQPKMSMTSKEWVIPPRPKPGRKPATDTPPTKRKAQNRAAQRAFRERRAARVGELEDLLDEQKRSQDTKEQELTQRIRDLEMEVQSFRSRCLLLESMLERERRERMDAEMQAETPSRRLYRADHTTINNDSNLMPHMAFNQHEDQGRRRPPADQTQTSRHFSISQIITPPGPMEDQSPPHVPDAPLSCGNCSPSGPCACAEQVLASVVDGCGKCGFGTSCMCLNEAFPVANQPQSLKRPSSASGQAPPREKRARADEDVESALAKKETPSSDLSLDSIQFRDSCGFCKDGTYCVCAEAAMATPAMTPTETQPAPVLGQTRTPPPSEFDSHPPMAMEVTADGAVKLPPRRPKASRAQPSSSPSRGCGPNGPGTCAQCQADPKSGLFCRLMAANLNRKDSSCCGKGAQGCCKQDTLPSLPSLGLSCAEAYQTLSSHRNFDRAADDIGSWLHKLKASPTAGVQVAQGRMPIEVEAASIMSVLKEFDVRFGRIC